MKRRRFLHGGAAAVASSALPPFAPQGVPAADQTPPSWTLSAASARYVVRLRGAALTVDCFHPGDAVDRADGAPSPPDDAALVAVGPARRPVAWRVAASRQADASNLRLVLSADDPPLIADVVFAIDGATGLLVRDTSLRHHGIGAAVDIVATLAVWCAIHEPIDSMLYLAGAWAHETQLQHGPSDGALRLESRTGKTGFEFQPYLALRTPRSTYLCEIFWSGNWILQATPQPQGAVLRGGLNDWRFRHRLDAGRRLALPSVLFGRLEGDLNAATQRLHDFRRARRPDPDRPIPVQFNSWYPHAGEPTADSMLALVPVARRLGCEAFVVDAGWYRTDEGESAADWASRTGDWRTSHVRFPNGLREVSRACRDHALRFGLWFEPEVIGPLSAIRRAHPEWMHHLDGKAPAPDQRAVLNLGIPAAWQHAFDRVTRILSAVGVDWMKWDFNADLGAGGWAPGLPAALTDQDPLVAHYQGLYRLQDAIRRWFPELILEMCASGGGRLDGEILAHAHVNWISDQPGALRKLAIHFGTQLAHPAVVCNDWLVDWPPGDTAATAADADGIDERGDLAFRLHVAMLGSFGISARADRWAAADFATVAAHVALYRDTVRPIVHHGDQYLLTATPPADGNGDWAAIWYVAKDARRGVLFAFRLASPETARVFALPGLLSAARYRAAAVAGPVTVLPGSALAAGLPVTIERPFQSALWVVETD